MTSVAKKRKRETATQRVKELREELKALREEVAEKDGKVEE